MNNRFYIMLVIALILAGGAAWMAKNWVTSQAALKTEQNVVPIVAAAIDIAYGTKIEATHIKMLGWPQNHVPKGAFTDTNQVIGKIAQRAFVADEALLEPQIKDKAAGSVLSALIPEGKRAMSVRVDDVAGVAGFITPGNMVDIIATNGKTNNSYVLLSNVKVLAIDQVASPEQDKPAVVRALTLEVTFQESTVLVKAMRSGPLYFTLRNPLDKQDVSVKQTEETPAKPIESVDVSPRSTEQKPPAVKRAVVIQKPRLTIIDWPTSGKRQQTETNEGAR